MNKSPSVVQLLFQGNIGAQPYNPFGAPPPPRPFAPALEGFSHGFPQPSAMVHPAMVHPAMAQQIPMGMQQVPPGTYGYTAPRTAGYTAPGLQQPVAQPLYTIPTQYTQPPTGGQGR